MKVGDLVMYVDPFNEHSWTHGQTGIVTGFEQTRYDGVQPIVFLHSTDRGNFLMDKEKYFKILVSNKT
tara:strand:+ start:1382 stop:1585 length:204 start_codon:yes stop_codon:yes gene_type:complete